MQGTSPCQRQRPVSQRSLQIRGTLDQRMRIGLELPSTSRLRLSSAESCSASRGGRRGRCFRRWSPPGLSDPVWARVALRAGFRGFAARGFADRPPPVRTAEERPAAAVEASAASSRRRRSAPAELPASAADVLVAGADAAGEARGGPFGQAHVDVGGAGELGSASTRASDSHLACGRVASPKYDQQAAVHRQRERPCSSCTRARPAWPAARARRRAAASAASSEPSCTRCPGRRPRASPPASAGSEPDGSAGPSTTPSAATAVRAPATVSAATGSCSITRMLQAVREARGDLHFAHHRVAARRRRAARRCARPACSCRAPRSVSAASIAVRLAGRARR